MKTITKSTNVNWNANKIQEWFKLILLTGGTQILVQGISFISGILIVRLLSTEEFAWYTLANTMLGSMVMLADSGIGDGVMAEGGKVWKDKKQLGIVLSTGLNLRRKLGVISLLVISPILAYLLLDHGANWLNVSLILLALIPAFFAALSDTFLEMAPKLHQDIKPLQINQITVSIGRLAAVCLFLFIFPFTFFALLANGLPRIYGNYKLKKVAARFASATEKPDPEVQKAVSKSIKRTLPLVIYNCLSGQLSLWLISLFGTTSNISELGALTRTSVIFSLVSTLFSTLVIPRFARMHLNKKVLLKNFLLVQVITFATSIGILFFLWLSSKQILWLLGENYANLDYELLLLGISGSVGMMVGVCSQLNMSRGWFIKPYYIIGINFSSTVISLMFFNVSSLVQIFYFNIVVLIVAYFLSLIYGLIKIKKTSENQL